LCKSGAVAQVGTADHRQKFHGKHTGGSRAKGPPHSRFWIAATTTLVRALPATQLV